MGRRSLLLHILKFGVLMATNQYLPFGTAGGANVLTPSAYSGLAARLSGFTAGTAASIQLNTVWRQSSVASAMLGEFILDYGNLDALDDGSVDNLETAFVRTLQKQPWLFATAGGTANAITITLSPAPVSYANLRIILVSATLANTSSVVTINVNGIGDRNIVRKGGGALRKGDIQPGPMLLLDNGSAYEISGTAGIYRTPLTGNLNVYVATSGADSGNDGLSVSSPFKTMSRAWSEIVNNYDLNGYTATVNVADGTYTGGVVATSSPSGGAAGTGSVVFKSSSGNASAVIVAQTTGGNIFLAQAGAQFTIKDMTLQCSGTNGNAVVAGAGGIVSVDGVRFGACTLSRRLIKQAKLPRVLEHRRHKWQTDPNPKLLGGLDAEDLTALADKTEFRAFAFLLLVAWSGHAWHRCERLAEKMLGKHLVAFTLVDNHLLTHGTVLDARGIDGEKPSIYEIKLEANSFLTAATTERDVHDTHTFRQYWVALDSLVLAVPVHSHAFDNGLQCDKNAIIIFKSVKLIATEIDSHDISHDRVPLFEAS